MGKPCSCTQFIIKNVFLLQVTRESISVLQVTCAASEHAMKSIEGLYDKIIITIVPSYTGKQYNWFVAVSIVTHTAHS